MKFQTRCSLCGAGQVNLNKNHTKIFAGKKITLKFSEGFQTNFEGARFDLDNFIWLLSIQFPLESVQFGLEGVQLHQKLL